MMEHLLRLGKKMLTFIITIKTASYGLHFTYRFMIIKVKNYILHKIYKIACHQIYIYTDISINIPITKFKAVKEMVKYGIQCVSYNDQNAVFGNSVMYIVHNGVRTLQKFQF